MPLTIKTQREVNSRAPSLPQLVIVQLLAVVDKVDGKTKPVYYGRTKDGLAVEFTNKPNLGENDPVKGYCIAEVQRQGLGQLVVRATRADVMDDLQLMERFIEYRNRVQEHVSKAWPVFLDLEIDATAKRIEHTCRQRELTEKMLAVQNRINDLDLMIQHNADRLQRRMADAARSRAELAELEAELTSINA